MPKLVITQSGENLVHELVDGITTIGRSTENLIQLHDPSVSGRHAQLQGEGDNFELTDLESTNGTHVNGAPIAHVVLRPGDQIRFGKLEGRYECELASEAQRLPVLAEIEAQPAEVSARPADFANASPFQQRPSEKDPIRTAIYAGAALAILAFLGSMAALAQMHAPAL